MNIFCFCIVFDRVVVRMREFTVAGLEQNNMTPRLVTSKQITPGISLLDVMFETSPLGILQALY